MALSTCKECDGKVSTLAKTCPHCGTPKPTSIKKTPNKKNQVMDIMCCNIHCTAWLSKVNVPKNKLSFYKCPRCGQGMKTFSKNLVKVQKTRKSKDSIWAHCSNRNCRDYTEMYSFKSSELSGETCNVCESEFTKARIIDGRPIMPLGGTYTSSTSSTSYENKQSSTSPPSTKASDGAWDKFLDGKLDLAAAFWGFGVFGSVIVGLICGFLAEAVGSFFIFVYIVATVAIISGLWQCADTHKKNMTAQKKSTVWGILTQAYCVLGGLGIINFIIEYVK